MSWRNIRLIFNREVSDQLRDRRTLFMVIVLPLLLYPALGIGMLQMSLLFSEQARTVVILGTESLPQPDLLNPEQTRILDRWFSIPGDSSRLQIVSDGPAPTEHPPSTTPTTNPDPAAGDSAASESAGVESAGVDSEAGEHNAGELAAGEADPTAVSVAAPNPERDVLLQIAREIRSRLDQVKEINTELQAVPAPAAEAVPALNARKDQLMREVSSLFSAGNIQVLIIFPEGFDEYVDRENARLANRELDESSEPRLRPTIIRNSANEKSLMAYGRVREALDAWELEILSERLRMANLPVELTSPVNVDRVDLAKGDELAANMWSKLFPAMLIVMAMTGAFHPAVDLGAGEKERGTMETLLISPALRSEIVIGKFLTVLLFSIVTALLNLTSMGLTGLHILNAAGGGQLEGIGDFSIPSVSQLWWVGIMAIPLASLFSSLSLAFALFAKSSKEGQYYLTPMLTITMGLTVFCLSPAVEITPFYSLMPVMGPALLLKGMLLGGASSGELLWYVGPVLSTSLMYSALGLYWAIDLFQREEVLFRESERFDLRTWIRHLFRDKEETPNFSEGLFCFVLIMLLQFLMLNTFGSALKSSAPEDQGVTMIQLLVVQQLVVIACPALFMGILLTRNPFKTFRFRLPALRYWGFGLALPLVLHPLALELQLRLAWFFPALSEGTQQALSTLSSGELSIWLVLFGFAVMPAVCEELAFRGFILSGFRHRGRTGLAIVLSSILFGVMHLIPQQVFNAALLGLVLGLLVVRSGSIFPAILFHFVNNGLGVLHGNYERLRETSALTRSLTVQDSGAIHYSLPVVLTAGVIAIVLLAALFRSEKPDFSETHPL